MFFRERILPEKFQKLIEMKLKYVMFLQIDLPNLRDHILRNHILRNFLTPSQPKLLYLLRFC